MPEAPSLSTRLNAWRRAPAIVGLVALALLHVSAAAHQFEHSADHELGVCESCGAYSQLEDTAVACAPGEEILPAHDGAVAVRGTETCQVLSTANYRSRAPPLS